MRVLRPLKSINAIPKMRRLIKSLLSSIPALANAGAFLLFFFLLFDIFATQSFTGQFFYFCRLTPEPIYELDLWPIDDSIERLCSGKDQSGMFNCPEDRYCGSHIEYNLSLRNENITNKQFINYGLTTFDHLGKGLLTLFVCITLEGWVEIMYDLMDGYSVAFSVIFFCFFVIIGAFFLLQVILAIIMDSFKQVDQQQQEEKDMEERKVRKLLQVKGLQASMAQNEFEEAKKSSREQSQLRQSIFEDDVSQDNQGSVKLSQRNMLNSSQLNNDNSNVEQQEKEREDSRKRFFENSQMRRSQNSSSQIMKVQQQKEKDRQKYLRRIKTNESKSDQQENPLQKKLTARAEKNRIFKIFYQISINQVFTWTIILLIIVNTVILAMDRYPLPENEGETIDMINDVLSWCFFLEMIIKLLGLGVKEYARDNFNLFDSLVVIISTVDNIIQYMGLTISGGTISVLRGLRLLRVFKLARSWTSFRILLGKIIISIKDISNFSVLLFLFIFIYTLLGMELYAYRCYFDENNVPVSSGGNSPRENFNYFLMGFNTVFQVLIGDNWPQFMFEHIRCTDWSAMIFFVTLCIFGNIILVNLFLAILLKNFEENDKNIEEEENELKISTIKKLKTGIYKSLTSARSNCKFYCLYYFGCQRCRKQSQSSGKVGVEEVINTAKDSNKGLITKDLQQENNQDEENSRFITYSKNRISSLQQDGTSNSNENQLKNNEVTYNNQIDDSPQKKDIIIEDQNNEYNTFDPYANQTKKPLNDEIDNQMTVVNPYNSVMNSQDFPKITVLQKKRDNKNQSDRASEQNNQMNLSEKDSVLRDNNLSKEDLAIPDQSPSKFKEQSQGQRRSTIARKSQFLNKSTMKQFSQLNGKSMYIFSQQNFLRSLCQKIVDFQYFDTIILIIIVISAILLTIDNPLDDPNGQKQQILNIFDIILTSIFAFECVIKIIVFGFIINGPQSYLKSPWNVLDFFIVIVAVISLIGSSGIDLNALKVLRLLRLLRPLKMINKNPNLKIAIQSLINAIPGILNVMLITLLFMMLFAILGVNFFKGKLFYCDTETVTSYLQTKIYYKWDCINVGGEWVNQDNNFDNSINSLVALINAQNSEGWADIMYTSTDIIDFNVNPQEYYSQYNMIFFFIFQVVGNMFFLNLFVGVVINTFDLEKQKLGKYHLLTPTQQEWVQLQLMIYKVKPDMVFQTTGNKIRDYCLKLIQLKWFDNLILVCIILNTLILSLKWYQQDPAISNIMENLNYFFSVIFILEAIIKIIALKEKYFYNGWNVFDFIIVLGTIIGIIVSQFSGFNVGPQTTVIRAFRIGRILRIIKQYKSLRKIFNTFVVSIPALANVGGLLFMFIYLYSVLGVNLFAGVMLQENLNVHANFQTFGWAFLTLIRCSTGESWNLLMFDASRDFSIKFQCIYNQDYQSIIENGVMGCGNGASAHIFFLSFLYIVGYTFLNLFIAIILEGFQNSSFDEDIRIKEDTLDQFKKAWMKYDPNGSGFIKVQDFSDLILDIIQIEMKRKDELYLEEPDLFNDEGEFEVPTHILFDLYMNHGLRLCYQNKDDIEEEIKERLGYSDSEVRKYLQKQMNNFIADCRLPTYRKMKYYNFYDIIEEFAKQVYIRDFKNKNRDELKSFREMMQKQKQELLNQYQSNETSSQNNYQSLQQELNDEYLATDFEKILVKLEEKGDRQNIQQYKEMKDQQIKKAKKFSNKLDTFKNVKEDNVIDSAFVVHGQIILKFVQNWINKKRGQKQLQVMRETHGSNFQFSQAHKSEREKAKSQVELRMEQDEDDLIFDEIKKELEIDDKDKNKVYNTTEQKKPIDENKQNNLKKIEPEKYQSNTEVLDKDKKIQNENKTQHKNSKSNIPENDKPKILQNFNIQNQIQKADSKQEIKHLPLMNMKNYRQFLGQQIIESNNDQSPSRIQTAALFQNDLRKRYVDSQIDKQDGNNKNRQNQVISTNIGSNKLGEQEFTERNSSYDNKGDSSISSREFYDEMNQYKQPTQLFQKNNLDQDKIYKKNLSLHQYMSNMDNSPTKTDNSLKNSQTIDLSDNKPTKKVPGIPNNIEQYLREVQSPIQTRQDHRQEQFKNNLVAKSMNLTEGKQDSDQRLSFKEKSKFNPKKETPVSHRKEW